MRLVVRESRSLWRDDILNSRFKERDQTELSFANDGQIGQNQRAFRLMQSEKATSFHQERRSRRIDIFSSRCNRGDNAPGQLVHGHEKFEMLVIHHEAKNAAPRATAKTVKGLALWANREGRRFFLMKWTERLKTRARPF